MLEDIKTKVLKERVERRSKLYLSTLRDYLEYIEEQVGNGEVNKEYLFNILRDIGFLDMIGAELPEQSFKYIRKILTSEVSFTGKGAPDFVDFDDLSYEMESYIWQKSNLPFPPRLNNVIQEEAWEDMWREVRGGGIGLILAGLDITATILGHNLVLDGDFKSIEWNDCWTDFDKKSKKYISELLENKVSFYHLSDNVFSYLTKFIRMPECPFRSMLLEIAKSRESYAQERYYRQIISLQEAKEIYFKTNLKFAKYSSTAQVYFYETALAQQILKAFILKACFAKKEHDYTSSNNWQILTTIDEGFDCEVPMISAGIKQYSVHMLDTPESKVSGWGIRKDRMKSFLSNDCHDFQGALFCSWKKYPTGEILVRFENHMKKDRLKELMGQKEEILANFIELSLDEVYKFDKREEFLQEAAVKSEKVVVVQQSESEQIANTAADSAVDLSGIIPAELRELEQRLIAENAAVFLIRIMAVTIVIAKLQYAFRVYKPSALRMGGTTTKPPEYNIIFVPTNFPDDGCEFNFLDRNSDQEDVRQLRFYGLKQDWRFIPLFIAS